MTVKLNNIRKMSEDLAIVKDIVAKSDNMATIEVCNMYIELCGNIAQGIQEDATAKIINRIEPHKTNDDFQNHHSIAEGMNDPSYMQQLAYKKEIEDEK